MGAKLAIEPQEAPIIEQIFSWFAEGLSLRVIADRLNKEKESFPSQSTKRGLKRKGWASSGVRVILKNEKYIGKWIYGRRTFYKDPATGRRLSRIQPIENWQIAEYPELRIVSDALWQNVQDRFHTLALQNQTRDKKGRLKGRTSGRTYDKAGLFTGMLKCGICGGGLTAVSGSRRTGTQRFGCGFYRNKGRRICSNDLTVKAQVLETKLLQAIQGTILQPEALTFLVSTANSRLKLSSESENKEREMLTNELKEVNQGLRNIEHAIVSGLTGETTGHLLKVFEQKKKNLVEKLEDVDSQKQRPIPTIDSTKIQNMLSDLQGLLNTDPARGNAFFRKHFSPIVCTPEKENGQRFYRASGAAREHEFLDFLGMTTPFAFGGCGGGI